MKRALAKWPSAVWINPVLQKHWGYTHSIGMIDELMGGRMFPMTLAGPGAATKELSR